MCFDYEGAADIYEETVVRSRKARQCVGCGDVVVPGDEHLLVSVLYDGHWTKDRLCNCCTQDRIAIYEQERDHGCGYAESWCPPEELDQYRRDADMVGETVPVANLRQLVSCFRAMDRLRDRHVPTRLEDLSVQSAVAGN